MLAGSYQPARCGVAHYTARLREVLGAEGVQVEIYTDRPSAARAAHDDVRAVTDGWTYRDLAPLARAIRRENPDLLHIQHAGGTYGFQRAVFLLPLLLRTFGYRGRVITTAHEYGWWDWSLPAFDAGAHAVARWGQRRGLWDEEDGFLLTGSDHLITTNADAERALLERLPHLAKRVTRVPIGVNITVEQVNREVARSLLRERYGWPAGAPVIAFFGFLHPVKGLETLLRAFVRVLEAQPEARLLLVGGVESLALRGAEAAHYWASLERLVAKLGLSGKGAMTGYVADEKASHLLWGADVGVLPFNHGVTLKSGSLLTLMAHGLPVVGTRPKEMEPGLDALTLVPPKDEAALAAALTPLIAAPALRCQQAEMGRAFVQRYTWDAVARQHADIYERLYG